MFFYFTETEPLPHHTGHVHISEHIYNLWLTLEKSATSTPVGMTIWLLKQCFSKCSHSLPLLLPSRSQRRRMERQKERGLSTQQLVLNHFLIHTSFLAWCHRFFSTCMYYRHKQRSGRHRSFISCSRFPLPLFLLYSLYSFLSVFCALFVPFSGKTPEWVGKNVRARPHRNRKEERERKVLLLKYSMSLFYL